MPMHFNGDYGKLMVQHSLPYEDHINTAKSPIIEKYARAMISFNKTENKETLSKKEIKELAYHM